MSRPDRTPRLIIALGSIATVAALIATPSHGAERLDENGKPCPTEAATARGLSPLTYCSPALDRRVVGVAMGEAAPRGSSRSGDLLSVSISHDRNGRPTTTVRYRK